MGAVSSSACRTLLGVRHDEGEERIEEVSAATTKRGEGERERRVRRERTGDDGTEDEGDGEQHNGARGERGVKEDEGGSS